MTTKKSLQAKRLFFVGSVFFIADVERAKYKSTLLYFRAEESNMRFNTTPLCGGVV
jgi:hypothetical protein